MTIRETRRSFLNKGVALNAIKDCVVMLPFGFEKLGFFVRQ